MTVDLHEKRAGMRVDDEKKIDGVRVYHEKEERVRVHREKNSNGVRVAHGKKSDGLRVHQKKEPWGES